MRRLLIIAGMLTLTFSLTAQGIEFFEGTWEEALLEAKKEDKIIFVDAFAVWCGPCKRMSQNVFPDKKVGEFYNKNFINLKLDMERGQGLEFRKKYPVSAFPTLFYIDYTGEVVQQVRGAQQVDGFIELGKAALKKIDRSQQYVEEYEKGNRDPELVFNYVRALNKAGKPSLAIANEYLREQEDLTTDFNLRFILEAVTEADSRIFGLMEKHLDRIIALESLQAVKYKVESACEATAQKGIEFKMEDLIEEAIGKMKKYYPEKATAFELSTEMDFYQAVGDDKAYLKACRDYGKKAAAGDPDELILLARNLVDALPDDEKAMKLAEGFAEEAVAAGQDYKHYLTYAGLLAHNGKMKEARTVAEQSLELARKEGPTAVRQVEYFLNRMKEG